ncbi:MazG nucleotide pyrophosphohydrolase domain-containing protein [Candidatus Lokiarchaeum ossiferum]|uniref:MazG nucleotide pyrophosphohydrolase domain-containing protein n=1 Tax=Candidatus Lokiarchaeum ossiferum TaxID=2951803 RepID=UPI00352FBE8F
MEISKFQSLMKDLYYANDNRRGIYRTTLWLFEEMGELSHELKKNSVKMDKKAIAEEMADIYAWVASLANLLEIDLNKAILSKYPNKCIKCNHKPCQCQKDL